MLEDLIMYPKQRQMRLQLLNVIRLTISSDVDQLIDLSSTNLMGMIPSNSSKDMGAERGVMTC